MFLLWIIIIRNISYKVRDRGCEFLSVSLCCLCSRDARGMTPFMMAVSGRAYPAALTILETAQKITKGMFGSPTYCCN